MIRNAPSFRAGVLLGWAVVSAALAAPDWKSETGCRSLELSPAGPGRVGFTLLNAGSTGVTFSNLLAQHRHLTNQILLNGSGVAAGDVDGDGLADLFFCGLDGPNRLYRNLGNWRFEDVTDAAGVACPDLDATGAVLADLDGDGSLDLVVNSIGGGARLFYNDGRGRMRESEKNRGLNAGRGGSSLALADYDGDGDLDLYIGNYRKVTLRDQPNTRFSIQMIQGQPQVSLINGRPLTDPEWTNRFVFKFTLGERSGRMQNEELGEPDLFCRNDGRGGFIPVPWTDGTFRDADGRPLREAPLDWTLSVMFRDLNGDGWPDLYTCSDFRTPDRFWVNDGQGHFRAIGPLALRHTTLSSMGLDAADVNRDGHDDLFVFDMLSRDHRLRFQQRIEIRPEILPIGAIDNVPQYPRNMLFLNRGDQTYAEIAFLSGLEAAEWAWTPLFLDVDLDGYEDLLAVNGFERDNMNVDALMKLEAAKAQRKMAPMEALQLRTLFPRLDTPNLAFRNLGNLRFAEVGRLWGFDQKGVSQGMAAADLDNDGDLDLAINNLNGPAFLLRNETTAPRLAVRLKGRSPNTRGIGARLRVEGGPVPQSQVIMTGGRYQSSDDPARVFACGSASRLSIEVLWPGGRRSLLTNALPNRLYEIDEPGSAPSPASPPPAPASAPFFADVSALLPHTHAEAPFDDFERQPLLPRRLSQLGPGLGWFDVDSDGWEDLLVGSGRGGRLAAFRNDGRGSFARLQGPPLDEAAPRDQTSILGWRRPDGRTAVLAGSASYEDGLAQGPVVRVYDLDSKTVEETLPGQASSTGPLALGDVDGDGQLDLFVGGRLNPGRYPEPASSLLFRGGPAGWIPDAENSKRLAGVGLVSGAVFSDLDGDGDPDLVLACEWGPVRVFQNDRGSLRDTTAQVGLDKHTGWWNGVSTGDFDGDGRLDIAASNWGRNTKYENWRAQPLRVYWGDLDGNETLDVVEAHYDDLFKGLVPSEQFHILGSAMPSVRERLGTWQAYADSSLAQIFGEPLNRAAHAEAACLESMVFLNRGGRFEPRELPLEAQQAPAFAVCVADFDGDGREDLFLSQNFFAVPPDASRYDAGRGLWLRGDGQGGFVPVAARESGILVHGEQRGAAAGDYDGDGRVDLAVSQNAAGTKLFRNTGGRPGLRVRLAGPPGNPAAAGAVLRLGNGASLGPAREIHAGSGYWSQDAAVQVLSAGFEARQIHVRWPGGKQAVFEIPAGARAVLLDSAGRITSQPH